MANYRLRIDGSTFRDPHNRQISLYGINVAGDAKFPAHPDCPSQIQDHFFNGDVASFVDRPFSVDEAHTHLSRLRRWGYNTIRYIFTWEAVEHEGPGKYDEDFIQHTIKILRLAKEYGFYVFMDPHQDVWSRYTGGSGAPMWTMYACGFDPEKFQVTGAAMVQNTWPEPMDFPKMAWATNYQRLACQTIFTFFFAGKDFAPKCIIDGRNIQDYLVDHFVGACKHLALRIHEAGDLHGDTVIGYESVNEPNKGFIGHADLSKIPADQNLRKYTCPTAWQAMLTGSGRACEMDTYDFGSLGPYKSGSLLVDPKGETAWLDPATWDDSKYGWKRDPDWKLGEDVWALHGVWDPSTDELKQPLYFQKDPNTGATLDQEYWTNHHFLEYYRKYKTAIRSVWPEAIMLMQPAPFEIPPHIKNTPDDDPNMVFASHFYDGITLITKKWNKLWNVDVLGILRGRYATPAFAIKIGETAIRNCFKDQLSTVRREGEEFMGVHPCVYTEIGIPYDMDNKHAYETGDYSSQSAAIDANHFAVEGSQAAGLTWWVYTASNSHFWGDNWNGEDLSIYSHEDRPLPSTTDTESTASRTSSPVTPKDINRTLAVDGMRSTAPSAPGYRAAEAYVRPTPVFTAGTLKSYGFDLKNCTFHLDLSASAPTSTDFPTEVFLPGFHFPTGQTGVEVSGGKWEIKMVDVGAGAEQQVLRWWHGQGEQRLVAKGVRRRKGTLEEVNGDEEGLMDGYWGLGKKCAVM